MYCTESWFIAALGLHSTVCLKFIYFPTLSKVIMDYCLQTMIAQQHQIDCTPIQTMDEEARAKQTQHQRDVYI